jgi:hypothetical protein
MPPTPTPTQTAPPTTPANIPPNFCLLELMSPWLIHLWTLCHRITGNLYHPDALRRVASGRWPDPLPEQRRFEHLSQKISSSLTTSGLRPTDLLATLPEARNRVFLSITERTPQLVSLGTVPAASAGSERSTQNPPVPRLECPERRNRVALGTRQGYALALRRQGLQTGAGRNGPRWRKTFCSTPSVYHQSMRTN